MNSRVFSVILLPTSECNFACDYCFEHKEPHRLSSVLVPLLTRRLLDHLEHEGIEECEIYWQGGEAVIMGPAWFADTGKLMDSAAAARVAASRQFWDSGHESKKSLEIYQHLSLDAVEKAYQEAVQRVSI
jgi:sulfatase maturation enzyme AslB (radical SAM superfamily)